MSNAVLGLRLKQQLTLTPRLQQSVKLLQLSALECVQELHQAIAQNPFLEESAEQPESTHSSPAARNTLSRPSASAFRLTLDDPGETRPGTLQMRLARMAAAERRSSMRALVQEPIKTRSMVISVSFLPGSSPM